MAIRLPEEFQPVPWYSSYMTNDHKVKLTEEKDLLTKELASLGKNGAAGWEASTETPDENEADPNTIASRFEDFEEKSALMVPLRERLLQVDAALKRLDDGAYGTCRVCGAAIEAPRLAANPAAETCMEHIEQ